MSSQGEKVTMVGLYGVSGSGKSHLLSQLQTSLGEERFTFYDGSEMIAHVVSGGLDAFQSMTNLDKSRWREQAVQKVRQEAAVSGKAAIVAGHLMFWDNEEEAEGNVVWTEADTCCFTHILYLDVEPGMVAKRREQDTARARKSLSVDHLRRWQELEKRHLLFLCREHTILLSIVPHVKLLSPDHVKDLIHDFQRHSEECNQSEANKKLDDILFHSNDQKLGTCVVLDADKTLAAADTGKLFWEMYNSTRHMTIENCPLPTLFDSPLGYSYTAFRQAMLMYEDAADDAEFDIICDKVAFSVEMYPEILRLLQQLAKQEHVGAVVVTCGLRRVWEKVLARSMLSDAVKVIGGGRIADGFVVTASVKRALVARLRKLHNMYVWAIGDSPLDLSMMKEADQAVVIVGNEASRSKTMITALKGAIDKDNLVARQIMLPGDAQLRMDTRKLPLVPLTVPGLFDEVVRPHSRASLNVHLAEDRNTVNLAMTPMRNAEVAGSALREAHRRVGWYLAAEFVSGLVSLEKYGIKHVLGHSTDGFRLLHEENTTIVALMRGGEPMAYGVSDAFPQAMFVHAHDPGDLKFHHLKEQSTVILVDSVVNTGKTIVDFVQHVRGLHYSIRIVIVAGIVQAQCISQRSRLTQALVGYPAQLDIVALRTSTTKFTGSGSTDTGNRLFNTTRLP